AREQAQPTDRTQTEIRENMLGRLLTDYEAARAHARANPIPIQGSGQASIERQLKAAETDVQSLTGEKQRLEQELRTMVKLRDEEVRRKQLWSELTLNSLVGLNRAVVTADGVTQFQAD